MHPDPTMLEIYDWLNNAGVGQFTMHSGLQRYTIPLGKVFKYVTVMRYDITGAGKREGWQERDGKEGLAKIWSSLSEGGK